MSSLCWCIIVPVRIKLPFVVYEIVAQCEPHKDLDLFDVGTRIRDEGLTPKIPEDCPQKLRQLMKMCWKKNPERRPNFEEICSLLEQ
jgi:hypothetical protein